MDAQTRKPPVQKWTQEWYAERFERLKDLAKERGCWPEPTRPSRLWPFKGAKRPPGSPLALVFSHSSRSCEIALRSNGFAPVVLAGLSQVGGRPWQAVHANAGAVNRSQRNAQDPVTSWRDLPDFSKA